MNTVCSQTGSRLIINKGKQIPLKDFHNPPPTDIAMISVIFLHSYASLYRIIVSG